MTKNTNNSISIRVNEVYKKLGKNQALNGVTMNFDAGLMHGLIGPEGAGKTTLFRTLLQLLKPNKGSVEYFLDSSPSEFSAIRPVVAYMPQQQSLYADLSIDEHLHFFQKLYSIAEEQFQRDRENLLQITRLKDFVNRPAGKLSGGMYKKLGLMCALLRSPSALLLDEPTNGVDPISRREFWELLYTLSDRKILIIVATAYLDEAERCACVHLIEGGKTIAEGVPFELLKKENAVSFDELFIRRSQSQIETYL